MTMDAGALIRQMQSALSAGAPVGDTVSRANANLQGGWAQQSTPPQMPIGGGSRGYPPMQNLARPQQAMSGAPGTMASHIASGGGYGGPVTNDLLMQMQGAGMSPDAMAQFMQQRGLGGAVTWGSDGIARPADPALVAQMNARSMGGGGGGGTMPGMPGQPTGQPDLQSLLTQLGWNVDPNTQFMGGNSAVLPTYSVQSRDMGATFGVTPPSDFGFGFGNGVPGGDMAQYLQNAGFPDMSIPNALRAGAPLGGSNVGRAAQQLGNVNVSSPQQMAQLGPSGLEFLRGMIETMLGIPFEDYLYASMQPFQGLQGAPMARGRSSGMMR